ncbi:MAG: hypothetical protein AVDCRST_MAG70-619, partial [uncultured Thermomicrobiales bacterium]
AILPPVAPRPGGPVSPRCRLRGRMVDRGSHRRCLVTL